MAQSQAAHKADSLLLRAASSAILAPLFLAAIWYGSWPFVLAITALAGLAGYEWALLINKDGELKDALRPPLLLVTVVLVAGLVQISSGVILAVLGAIAIALAARKQNNPEPDLTGAGVLYLGLAAVAIVAIRLPLPDGLQWSIFLCAVVWGTDIGAYIVGRTVGGVRLAPAISPGKTWSGLFGGVIAAILAGLCVGLFFGSPALASLAFIALALTLISQAGDLLESFFKRRSGADDSGWLIPGHGGILDRVDGLMPAAMLLWVVVAVVGWAPQWP
ncbi:MAG: phosphatidate cytidylyltransferase [Pseudomonadota bacterium]